MRCLNVKTTLLNPPVTVDVNLLNGIECSTSVLNPSLNIKVVDVTPKLKVIGQFVCPMCDKSYLRVIPDIVWLTPDMLSE